MASASIPCRRTLNVQLGPAAAAAEDESAMMEDVAYDPLSRRPRRASRQQVPPRVRWSRMAAQPGQLPAVPPPALDPPPSLALLSAGSAGSASLCQLVDFVETRDLIRRQREAAKQVAEVDSIVSHLNLDRENAQDSRGRTAGWATFRQQPNSQFKQYVFQRPGRAPALPATDCGDEAALAQQNQQHHVQPSLQRSRTTLGLVSGRPLARHSRPEPLGVGALRRSEFQASLSREATRASIAVVAAARPGAFRGDHGCSSSVAPTAQQQDFSDSLYGQFAHRKTKSFRLA